LRDTEAERDSITAERDAITAERDALVEKLTADSDEVEALATQRLTDGSDVWQAINLPDVLTDAGDIDEAKGSHGHR
jgi:hypothetical protein